MTLIVLGWLSAMEGAYTMMIKLGAWALTELQSAKVPKKTIMTILSDMHQNCSIMDNDIDKIGNFVSILISKENNFLE
jgi:hypothetical protein